MTHYSREDIKDLLEKIGPIPWRYNEDLEIERPCNSEDPYHNPFTGHWIMARIDGGSFYIQEDLARFIAASPSIISQLLEENLILREGFDKMAKCISITDHLKRILAALVISNETLTKADEVGKEKE